MVNTQNDIFDQARERLDIQEVAARYGVQVGRGGKALCPFHNDRHPSMSFKGNRYRCFVCDIGGDSIDLAARLLNLSPVEALRRLNSDFLLGLPIDKPPDKKALEDCRRRHRLQRAFEQWEQEAFFILSRYLRQLRSYQKEYRPGSLEEEPSPYFLESLTQMEKVEYWLSILTFGTYSEKLNLYNTTRGRIKEIADRERQTPGASSGRSEGIGTDSGGDRPGNGV